MYLSEEQNNRIKIMAAELESRCGVEFVAAVVGKCDSYPEIPWKAFALAAALSALTMIMYQIVFPAWVTARTSLISLVWVLGVAAVFALLTVFWPALARIFLNSDRAESESRQYAEGLFLDHALYRTRRHTAILMLIALFERCVILLPDSGVRERLEPGQLEAVISEMAPHLRGGDHFKALVCGIDHLDQVLTGAGFTGAAEAQDQIRDELIQQKGAVS